MINNINLLENNDKVLELFGIKILDKKYSKQEAFIELYFGKNCISAQTLPEVIQLYIAIFFAKDAFGVDSSHGQFRKIKFPNFLQQDKGFVLKLECNERGIIYSFFDNETTYSSGQLPTKNYLSI